MNQRLTMLRLTAVIPHLSAFLILLAMTWPALGAQRAYQIDPVHSRIVFQVDHLGFSRSLGTFSGLHGTVLFDKDHPDRSNVDVSIPVATLDLGDDEWNQRMFKRDFFNVGDHATARFKSTAIEALDDATFRVTGLLQLRDIEREVFLDVRLNRRGRHPLTLRSMLGFSASAALNRSEFEMTAWKSVIGDRVDLIIQVEAVRGKTPKSRVREEPSEDGDAASAPDPSKEAGDAVAQ